jgi:hypothetical protein
LTWWHIQETSNIVKLNVPSQSHILILLIQNWTPCIHLDSDSQVSTLLAFALQECAYFSNSAKIRKYQTITDERNHWRSNWLWNLAKVYVEIAEVTIQIQIISRDIWILVLPYSLIRALCHLYIWFDNYWVKFSFRIYSCYKYRKKIKNKKRNIITWLVVVAPMFKEEEMRGLKAKEEIIASGWNSVHEYEWEWRV